MNWKKIAGIIAVIVVAALIVFKLISNKEIAEGRVFQYDKEMPVTINVDTLKLKNTSSSMSFSGLFHSYKESKLSAEQQGIINKLWVDVGSYVKKGETLIELDNSLLNLKLQSVEVKIEEVEKDIKRYKILSQAEAIQGIKLEKAEFGLKSAKVEKAILLEQISKTIIKAPFDGIITAKLNEEGGFAAPGIPLLIITDIAQLKFTVNVSENDLKLFRPKQSYDILIDAMPELTMKGELIMIGSKANTGSSFPIQFLLTNTRNLDIKSGMFGKAHISNDGNQSGIIIPASAIVGYTNQQQVYLVKNGKAVLENIIVSKRLENKAIVSSGLKEGDVLIISGFINLFEGANVVIK